MTFIDTYPEENGLDLFKFLLNLSNPIAYNTNGFVANGIDVEKHADKLKRLGGRSAMLRSVKMLEIETGAKASERGCGIGVLRLINYKRRGKIAVPDGA